MRNMWFRCSITGLHIDKLSTSLTVIIKSIGCLLCETTKAIVVQVSKEYSPSVLILWMEIYVLSLAASCVLYPISCKIGSRHKESWMHYFNGCFCVLCDFRSDSQENLVWWIYEFSRHATLCCRSCIRIRDSIYKTDVYFMNISL